MRDEAMNFLSKCSYYKIELSRPSGVYIAGETIEGVLRLNTKDEIKCRGVHLKLRGEGYCRWHTGSGDDREDHSLYRMYCSRQITAYGTFYKTATLSGAGKNAKFDPAVGSGDVVINLEGLDLSTLTLAVRPMDYDWGKKDDLLGEVLVPVEAALLGDKVGTEVSFPLKRNGKEEEGEVTLSATMGVLASGAEVLRLQCVQATGLRSADWFSKNDVYVQVYVVDPKTDAESALPLPDKSIMLPQGELAVPFALKIPLSNMPSSLDFGWGDKSYVRWSLYSNIDIAFRLDPSCRKYITVLSSELPRPQLFAPLVREDSEPNTVYGCDCCCFKCCAQGTAQFSAAIDKAYLNPGEKIFIAASARNDSDATMKFTVKLVLNWKLQTVTKRKSGNRTFKLYSQKISKGETIDWPADKPRALTVPTVPPTFSGSRYDPLTWNYHIEVAMNSVEAMGTSIEWNQPVLVGAFPIVALKALPVYKDTILGDRDPLAPITTETKGDPNDAPVMQYPTLGEAEPLPVEVLQVLGLVAKAEGQVGTSKDEFEDMNHFGDFEEHMELYPQTEHAADTPLVAMPTIVSAVVVPTESGSNDTSGQPSQISPEIAPVGEEMSR